MLSEAYRCGDTAGHCPFLLDNKNRADNHKTLIDSPVQEAPVGLQNGLVLLLGQRGHFQKGAPIVVGPAPDLQREEKVF